jgi:hypothetical protein
MNLDDLSKLAQPADTKIVLLVLDGLGGLPRQPGGPTELEAANTPNLDRLAAEDICSLIEPVGTGHHAGKWCRPPGSLRARPASLYGGPGLTLGARNRLRFEVSGFRRTETVEGHPQTARRRRGEILSRRRRHLRPYRPRRGRGLPIPQLPHWVDVPLQEKLRANDVNVVALDERE